MSSSYRRRLEACRANFASLLREARCSEFCAKMSRLRASSTRTGSSGPAHPCTEPTDFSRRQSSELPKRINTEVTENTEMKKRKAKTLWKDFLGNVPFYEPRKDFLCALRALCVL